MEAFWSSARSALGISGPAPLAWSFGATPEMADELLALVLAGTKTAGASELWDYEDAGDPLPQVGDLSIVLDGASRPRALLRIVDVRIAPFDQVDAEHARLEGEGDLSLDYWRRAHEWCWTTYPGHDRGFSTTMPVVLERYEVLHTAD